jgi:hypothetical protein
MPSTLTTVIATMITKSRTAKEASEAVRMCEEKKRLLHWYEQVELAFSKTFTALNRQADSVSRMDYEGLKAWVDVARAETERARMAFDAHVLEHRC